jgi:probable F420-dependent oxidoreductase
VDVSLPPVGAWVGQYWQRTADEARADARRLEEAGYGMLWISEAFGREILAFAGVLLAATDRIRVGTGIANLWVRDPAAMINGARTLAEAFPGRFVLGVGVSHQPLVSPRGHAYQNPLAVTRAYVEAMSAVPYRAPAPEIPPPVLVGALGNAMLELAGQLADGVHPYLVTADHTRGAREILGDGPVLAPEQAVVLCDDPEIARAVGRQHLATYFRLPNYVRSWRRQGFTEEDLADGGSDHLVDGLVAWGDVDAIVERIRAHHAAGADHVALQPLAGDGVPDPVEQLLTLAPAVLQNR